MRDKADAGVWSQRSLLALLVILVSVPGWGAADPFLVTYTHEMEEPGNLEMGIKSVTGRPSDGNRFLGVAAEFEYSLTRWWTTEAYVDGQATSGMRTIFTGYRWENRFRILRHEYWINPVFYVEYEDINGADGALLEVVGHDDAQQLVTANRIACREKDREVEAKLILGSTLPSSSAIPWWSAAHWHLPADKTAATSVRRTSNWAPRCTAVLELIMTSVCGALPSTWRQTTWGAVL